MEASLEKIGRNDPCPCGSEKKYKKCCYLQSPIDLELELRKIKARDQQAQSQQGLGRQIISGEFQDRRFLAVGSRLFHFKKTETFHDFLARHYLPSVFGSEWLRDEDRKEHEGHPLVLWRKIGLENLDSKQLGKTHIKSASMNGAMYGYLNLAYNLYLLGHNSEIQNILVKRLKHRASFEGAIYETFVAAMLIKAGFKIELEDEQDGSSSHGEFIAISPTTGKKFWVEAKARRSGKVHGAISNQLYKALKKETDLIRVIFIELSLPSIQPKIDEIMSEIKNKEENLIIKNKPADKAYIFVTNHGYLYDLKGTGFETSAFIHGFKINDFHFAFEGTVRQIIEAREAHQDMFGLFKSIEKYQRIPSTFDGEIPEFAYNPESQKQRLLIGNEYIVPTPEGEQVGKLTTATVIMDKKEVVGVYLLKNGQSIICNSPLSDDEMKGYYSHPETFFGVPIHPGGKAENDFDILEFFLDTYQNSSKETLLRLLGGGVSNPEKTQKELLIDYLEVLMHSWGSPANPKK